MTEFIQGAKYILAGFKLIIQPGVRLYVLIPLLVNTSLFALAIGYGSHLLDDLIDWLSAQWAWLEWVTWLLWPLFLIVSLTIVFFLFSILSNLIAAPFNGMLAAAVEKSITGKKLEGANSGLKNLTAEMLKVMKSETRKFIYFGLRAVPLVLLFFIPFVQSIAPFTWIIFGAWMLALEYIDYPLGNQGMFFPEVRAKIGEQRALGLGFGTAVFLLTMLPVINFIAMPVSVAAATKLSNEKMKKENDFE